MPLFMDYHIISDITIDEVKKGHIAVKAEQDKYGVKYLQFWVNQETGSLFCLIDAPDKKSCKMVHQEAHGDIACQIVEVEDLIAFGDGYYWGDYLTIDGIWKDILGEGGWDEMLKWDLKNHKIYVHSTQAASYLVEFDHEHLVENGDTIRSSGSFTYGMQKIDGGWKAVTAHVTHIPNKQMMKNGGLSIHLQKEQFKNMKHLLLTGILILTFLSIFFGSERSKSTVRTVDIGVVVTDMEKSFDFYTKILGMEQTGTWSSSSEMSAKYGVNSGKAFDIIDLKLDCDEYVLKYKLNKTEGNNRKDTLESEREDYGFEKIGSRYLTINVESVDPFIRRMKENNVKYKLVSLPDGNRVVLLHDPDGALLEIASY